MTNSEILSRIDHTLLKAQASWEDIQKICAEAVEFKTASACIPPSFVKPAAETFKGLNVCTVLGFPLGYSLPVIKIREAELALKDGASELDMVINIGDVKNGHFDKVLEEIMLIKKTAGSKILKVIIETCYLTTDEKIRLCDIVTEAGADYIKTSTGLGPAGATLEDILLFKEHIGPKVRMKAAGGIRTREDMVKYLEAGCDRIGTSSAAVLITSN
ncbi:deoxyribose-phosphate aldolase [Leadbettera azotonutricia]|uniref:Deoxyribose-phosphate aldolase n=1 Tax=Leadbettera azotonutricia (strain ATCC BAA-888 / DSM 13862 / ZAS-9) TaxID=545695 RepID=F5Y964_LEAAZ|nr:deoxyribose-phosphate aldolase [Leadbettera azotonutricia]AEF81740.1 deoxyribose-phosphate aldolase [Leadbettera azotonutricia ZAS-9]